VKAAGFGIVSSPGFKAASASERADVSRAERVPKNFCHEFHELDEFMGDCHQPDFVVLKTIIGPEWSKSLDRCIAQGTLI
jgi:hypothetical protein